MIGLRHAVPLIPGTDTLSQPEIVTGTAALHADESIQYDASLEQRLTLAKDQEGKWDMEVQQSKSRSSIIDLETGFS